MTHRKPRTDLLYRFLMSLEIRFLRSSLYFISSVVSFKEVYIFNHYKYQATLDNSSLLVYFNESTCQNPQNYVDQIHQMCLVLCNVRMLPQSVAELRLCVLTY